jgi:hypothetical protein
MIKLGANRRVVLFGHYAIKTPRLRSFRFGRLNNLNEYAWQHEDERYCPVLWCDRWGLVQVMLRVRPIKWVGVAVFPPLAGVERKPDSWGWLGRKVVAVDYGWRAPQPPAQRDLAD